MNSIGVRENNETDRARPNKPSPEDPKKLNMTRTALSRSRVLLHLTPVTAVRVLQTLRSKCEKPSEWRVLPGEEALTFMSSKVESHRMGKKHSPGLERWLRG